MKDENKITYIYIEYGGLMGTLLSAVLLLYLILEITSKYINFMRKKSFRLLFY